MARIDMGDGGAEAASLGCSADVLFELGLIYCNGREVERDYVAAHKWFNLAALKGNRAAKHNRGEIALEMTGNQIAEAQRQARAWLTVH